MTRVVFLGADGDAMARLAEALARVDGGLSIETPPDGQYRPRAGADVDAVIVAVGDRRRDEFTASVGEARDAGLPVVALLPAVEMLDIDPAAGVLDFCFPPYVPEEIALRLHAVIRRSGRESSPRTISLGELSIDQDRYEVRVSGRKVDLTYKEYELLKVLASNPGRVFSRESLLRTVWEYDYFGGTRTVDVHVRRLRAKIADANQRLIETVRNVGYRFRAADSSPE